MTKRKGLILCLVVAALMLLAGAAVASEVDPIVCSMELDPNKLAAPGTVNVTITISNSGNTDMKDPVVLYRMEGFDMFDQMIASIREDTARLMLTVQIRQKEEPKREQVAKPTATSADGTDRPRTVRKTAAQKVGRNDPCPCGSGKKYKKCCGRDAEA